MTVMKKKKKVLKYTVCAWVGFRKGHMNSQMRDRKEIHSS